MILLISIVIGLFLIRQLYLITLRNNVNNKLQIPFVEKRKGAPHILFYDIETTGLLPRYIDFESNVNEFPRVVQIAWLVFDKDGFIIKKENHIIKQEKEIPLPSVKIHGITTEYSNEVGVSFDEMVKMFIEDFKEVEYIASHNARFDLLVLQGDLIRNGFEYSLKGKKIHCTMLNTTRLCKLRKTTGHSGYKWPKLEELIGFVYLSNPKFNLKLENTHNASFDVQYTAKCYYELIKRNYEFKNNYRKVWEYVDLPKNLRLLKPSQNLNEFNDYEHEKVENPSPNFLKFVIGFSLFVLIISVFLNTTDNDKNRQIYYTTEDVNLRFGPSYSDSVKEVLLKGEKVFSSDSIVNGYKMILNNDNSVRGWISESYLEE